jgi:hypothetical protein
MQYALSFDMTRKDVLQLRLTDEEKLAFENAAAVSGIPLSAWARERLRIAATQELANIGQRAAFLKPIPLNRDGK